MIVNQAPNYNTEQPQYNMEQPQMQPPAGAANTQPGMTDYKGPDMAQPQLVNGMYYAPQQGGMINPQYTGGAYPMPPGGAYQPAGQPWGQQQPAMAQQPVGAAPIYQTAIPLMALSMGSAPVDCPVCRKRGLTRTEFQAGNTTLMWAILFCVFVGLPCIPYLMNGTKNVKHSCGNCGVHLATWNRGGQTEVFQFA